MKFGILINEGPYTHQASDSAYNFTKAALERGHEIFRVFFYNDGVNNGTRLGVPPQDDRNITKQWSELGEQYDLDLVVCIAAAQRRGLLDADMGFDAGNNDITWTLHVEGEIARWPDVSEEYTLLILPPGFEDKPHQES